MIQCCRLWVESSMLVELRAIIVRWYVGAILGSTPAPSRVRLYDISVGDYFTCGVLAEKSLRPVCWCSGLPSQLRLAISPGLCMPNPCVPGFYEFNNGSASCKSGYRICLPCSNSCPAEMYQKSICTSISDKQNGYNYSGCVSDKCLSGCSDVNPTTEKKDEKKDEKYWSLQLLVIIIEVAFAVLLSIIISLTVILYVQYKLRNCRCSAKVLKPKKNNSSSSQKDYGKVQPDLEEIKIRRAQLFTYEELENATHGFKEESQVGKGSYSCVFKGVLKDGTVVAFKWAIMSADMKKNSKEFNTELDLLSRLNHAHFLNLLGYYEEGEERLLVYEYMANGSLHQHLHGKNKNIKEQLDWVKRVTISVQAARGIEYFHSYAYLPVIHRDIKSSNILIWAVAEAGLLDFVASNGANYFSLS